MTPGEAPRGTVATLGHPANDIRIVKGATGWRYIDTGEPVDSDDFRGGWDILWDGLPDDWHPWFRPIEDVELPSISEEVLYGTEVAP